MIKNITFDLLCGNQTRMQTIEAFTRPAHHQNIHLISLSLFRPFSGTAGKTGLAVHADTCR
ncbi:MAG: hypothetical protein IBJ09_14165 [Bacteroidia bacterium]|nr:hypothetical protein [Bacteroidia bacterium]